VTRSPPRALYAAGLLTALTGALLVAWFVSGWAEVRGRQRAVRDAPRVAAEQRGQLRAELDALLAREVRRPYFHYQNLMHDPSASAGSPSRCHRSPTARRTRRARLLPARRQGPRATLTINDEVPELSEPKRPADNRAFRDQVVRDLSRQLAPPVAAAGPLVADAGSATRPRPPRPLPQPEVAPSPQPQAQVIKVDPMVYAQNTNPNAVYSSQSQRPYAPVNLLPAPRTSLPSAIKTPAPVTITISPLEWRTLPFAGVPTIVAIRQVQTPDGALTQGFVVDRPALTRWLAAKAGEMVAELHPDDLRGAAVAPGWGLTVEPNPGTLAQAAGDSDAIARTFLIRFVGIGSIAAVAAALVLLFVMRAEKLARERSQFAAAAAHELRTPLAGLQLYGDMLADGLGDPGKVHDYARRMKYKGRGQARSRRVQHARVLSARARQSQRRRPGGPDRRNTPRDRRTRTARTRSGRCGARSRRRGGAARTLRPRRARTDRRQSAPFPMNVRGLRDR
jgi:hypothetical protein